MGEDVRWGGGGGESLPLHNVGEDVRWRVEILGRPYLCIMCGRGCTLEGVSPGHLYLCIMCGRGCTLEGGNPGVSLPLHNVWERMYTGGGKFWGVPTSAKCVGEDVRWRGEILGVPSSA